ncbi:O-antigen polymerase [Butyrivibrio hungatei]|uniref:O-antigen polymerase n=1 Tax=Butyrivibrio hungatei TaxID=185008 RepID=UPI0012DC9CA0|nr:O-antigen polymerase [Butyrivibrio hungatei]
MEKVNQAFLMCFVTYAVAMFTLEWFLNDLDKDTDRITEVRKEKKDRKKNEIRMGKVTFSVVCSLFTIGFFIYVKRTGGFSAWIKSANDAFFSRGGAGMFYLLFTHALLLLLFFEGQRGITGWRGYFRRFLYIVLLCASYTFIGSKSTTFMMILMLMADKVIKLETLDKKSILLIVLGLVIFVVGMIVRLGEIMTGSLITGINQILNYFDTFENFLIMTRDYSPDFLRTFFLPLNWPLVKLGITNFSEFFDMSVWLTMKYYPDSWMNGGTMQWPIEADMYMSFYYWGGIPLLIIYFATIALIYKKAQNRGAWQFIYIIEGFYILSHLRGGFLIYWYYWLIPLYIWLIIKYDKKQSLEPIKRYEIKEEEDKVS